MMRRLQYRGVETTRLAPQPGPGKLAPRQRAIIPTPAPNTIPPPGPPTRGATWPQPPGYNLGKNPGAQTKTVPPYHRRLGAIPQLLHPELSKTSGLYPKIHVALPGQPSSVIYSYPTGVAQFYFWYRKLTDDEPYRMFWPGNHGFGAPSRKLANNQAGAIIWGSAPTTANTSLRALIAQAGK